MLVRFVSKDGKPQQRNFMLGGWIDLKLAVP